MRFLVFLLSVFLLFGCGKSAPDQPPEINSPPQETSPSSSRTSSEDLSLLRKQYEKAKEAYSQNPTRDNAERYVDATVGYANAVMLSDATPREKYPRALRLYEEALKVDPANKVAQENRQLILDIYKSLGKKPPEGGN
jgi:tetratricopeptide (TPR) repeat protein